MAIHNKEDQVSKQQEQVNPQQQFNSQQQTTQQQSQEYQEKPRGRGFSFRTASMFSPIQRMVGSEFYLKLKEQLVENYKHTADKDIEIKIIDMDKSNEPALAYSSIVVAMRHKVLAPKVINVYTLILEATGNKLTPIIININGKQVERIRTASAAYDSVLKEKVANKVSANAGNSDLEVNLVGATVVPDNFDVEDAFKVHKLALNAGLACYTGFALASPDFEDIDLTNIDRTDVLVVGTDFARRELEDACGNKMRSDVLVTFEARKETGGQYNSVNTGDREVNISEVSGFIDLVYSPPAPVNPYLGAPQQNIPGMTQKYAARFIITNLNSNIPYTFRSILLALSTSMSIKNNNSWIQVFKPSMTSNKEIDITDIGALNIDANLENDPSGFGKRIKTKYDNFKLEDLGQFISDVIKPNLLLSIDCPIVGPQSWYLDAFSEACLSTIDRNLSPNGVDVTSLIYNAAVALTGGVFRDYFNPNNPIFEPILEYVHNGHWTDKDGLVRDIRDIDYIAVCNLIGDKNPQYIREWSDTFTCLDVPLEERMDVRRRMISTLTYDTAVFTGYSQRVTLTTDFVDALAGAIQATGIPVRLDNSLNSMEFFNTRRGMNFVSNTMYKPGAGFGQTGFATNYNVPGFDPRMGRY